LLHLLKDVERLCDHYSLRVLIFDDNSAGCVGEVSDVRHAVDDLFEPTPDYQHICHNFIRMQLPYEYASERGWRYFVSSTRHGKRWHWHVVEQSYALLRQEQRRGFYLFLPDDVRLSSRFFDRGG
jgi:NAD(P)H-flavin reductase